MQKLKHIVEIFIVGLIIAALVTKAYQFNPTVILTIGSLVAIDLLIIWGILRRTLTNPRSQKHLIKLAIAIVWLISIYLCSLNIIDSIAIIVGIYGLISLTKTSNNITLITIGNIVTILLKNGWQLTRHPNKTIDQYNAWWKAFNQTDRFY